MVSPLERIGSLIVGLNNAGIGLEAALSYAEDDARAFSEYIRAAWPASQTECNIALYGKAVTCNAIHASLADLRERGPFDLFFLYFAGHAAEDGAGQIRFLTADEATEDQIYPAQFDKLIETIPASRLLLFFDSCYAERLLHEMAFFTRLDNALARLYVCSSRGGQYTWEDDVCRHGVFSAFLLDALNTGVLPPVGTLRTSVSVDRELFPYLCEQVPLYVYSHKNGEEQEPVKGGIARTDVLLPVGNSLRSGEDLTVLGVIRRRLRRAATVAATTLLLAYLFVQIFLFHAVVGENGRVVLRRGIREIAPLTPPKLAKLVETDYDKAQFAADPAQVAALQSGSVWGVWSQVERHGYRRWASDLLPSLLESARSRATLELTGTLPPGFLARSPEDGQGWAARLVADSLILSPAAPEQRINWLQSALPRLSQNPQEPFTFAPGYLDFTVLSIAPEQMAEYEAALATLATVQPDSAFSLFEEMLKVVRHRAAQSNNVEVTARELQALSEILRTLGAARVVRQQEAVSAKEYKRLLVYADHGYELWAVLPLSYLGELIPQAEVAARLRAYLKANERVKQGTTLDDMGTVALDGLARTVKAADQAEQAITAALATLTISGLKIDESPDLQRFLRNAAGRGALPASTKAMLFARVAEWRDEFDFFPLEGLQILAANARYLSSAEQRTLMDLLHAAEDRFRHRTSMFAGTYGLLGAAGLATDGIVAALEKELLPSVRPRPAAPDAPQQIGTEIIVDDEDEIAALGLIAQQMKLNNDQVSRLYECVANRPSLARSAAIIRGLARQRIFASEPAHIGTLTRALATYPTDAGRRTLETDIAVEMLLTLPRAARLETIDQLQLLQRTELKPEIRTALARLIIAARSKMNLREMGLE